jgi:uncharacterized protein YndB with AHSA1/START domain
MAVNEGTVDAPPDVVFAVLLDPYCYEHWVVGNRYVRGVDPDWPAPRSQFHHNVGFGPFNTSDSTMAIEVEPPRRLVLEARALPVGVARVEITIEPLDGGRSRVRLVETPVRGPMARIHNPAQDLLIRLRNVECLRRLRHLAEDRVRTAA